MRILGVIPARGGSKGIPGKNIKPLKGKPLIAWTIDQAHNSKLLDRVIVSTDSEQIAEVAQTYGAVVPFIRPPELATDSSPTVDVVIHALHYFEKKGVKYDAVCLLQCSSPYRPPGFIDETIKYFIQSEGDSLISTRRVPDHYNPHWTFEEGSNGFLQIATGEDTIIPRRQELPLCYVRDGSIYITRVEVLRQQRTFTGKTLVGFSVENAPLLNIDTPEDWVKAEKWFDL